MQITIKGSNYTITDDVRSIVGTKLGAIERFLGKDESNALATVEIQQFPNHHEGNLFRAEMNIDTNGKLYRATADAETMEIAIDRVEGEVRAELRRVHGKSRSLMRRTGRMMKGLFGR